ncbi:MAG: Methyltransferase type 11 [Geminicoccaceae bacterium]|jgi:ubiquinone/menaquinone biosynthesis C-methylase UbiE|nr:Methyltransferase type 11 [Geminicoccaceae bacterium]
MAFITPPRLRSVEYLDEPGIDPRIVRRSLADVALANSLFGGTRCVLLELSELLPRLAPSATLLDVGSGLGDIPAQARELARRNGVELSLVTTDRAETLALASRARSGNAVCGDAAALPFATRSVDVVMCSQTLHHFDDAQAANVVRELDRVARTRVIVADLRRSWLAAAGLWCVSFPLRFHPVSRHDGVVSVMRGYTTKELRRLVASAIGHSPVVRRRMGWRVTASWCPEAV